MISCSKRGRVLGAVVVALLAVPSFLPVPGAEARPRVRRDPARASSLARVAAARSGAGAEAKPGGRTVKASTAVGAARSKQRLAAQDLRRRPVGPPAPPAPAPAPPPTPDVASPQPPVQAPEPEPEPGPTALGDALTPALPPDDAVPPRQSGTGSPERPDAAPQPEPASGTHQPRRGHDRDPEVDVPEAGSPPPSGADQAAAEPAPPTAPEPDLLPAPAAALSPGQSAAVTTPHGDPSTRGDLAAVLGAVAAPARAPAEIGAVLDAFGSPVPEHDGGIALLAAVVDVGAVTPPDPTLAAMTLTLSAAFGDGDARSLGTLFGTG